jgi:hypothetical protein
LFFVFIVNINPEKPPGQKHNLIQAAIKTTLKLTTLQSNNWEQLLIETNLLENIFEPTGR